MKTIYIICTLVFLLLNMSCSDNNSNNDTVNDMSTTLDMSDMSKDINKDLPNDLKDMSQDLDSADIVRKHQKIEGTLDNLKSCSDVCTAKNLQCDGMYQSFLGKVAGIARYEEDNLETLQCNDIPKEMIMFDGSFKLESYECYCI